MPYIKEERRMLWSLGELESGDASPGDLNWLITTLLDEWLSANGLNYSNVNTVVGVLDCVKMEFYRRVVAPYEDNKINENGDVYTCNLNK